MRVYLDSSAIVKLYVPEADSASVAAYVHTLKEPLPFSHLHEIEVKNALRLKVFRKEALSRAVLKSIRTIDKDMGFQILKRPELNSQDYRVLRRFGAAARAAHILNLDNCKQTGRTTRRFRHVYSADSSLFGLASPDALQDA